MVIDRLLKFGIQLNYYHPYLSKHAFTKALRAELPTDSAKKRRRMQLSMDDLSQWDDVFVNALNLNADEDDEWESFRWVWGL